MTLLQRRNWKVSDFVFLAAGLLLVCSPLYSQVGTTNTGIVVALTDNDCVAGRACNSGPWNVGGIPCGDDGMGNPTGDCFYCDAASVGDFCVYDPDETCSFPWFGGHVLCGIRDEGDCVIVGGVPKCQKVIGGPTSTCRIKECTP